MTEKEVDEGKFYMDKTPLSKTVLNDIGSQGNWKNNKILLKTLAGLLSYSDFCFLLTLLSTPPRSDKNGKIFENFSNLKIKNHQ